MLYKPGGLFDNIIQYDQVQNNSEFYRFFSSATDNDNDSYRSIFLSVDQFITELFEQQT